VPPFWFFIASQKDSHVKLRKQVGTKTITTIVPTHHELAPGTVHGVLKLAKIEDDEFWKYV
jgi:predicted RNA binding protein YcfA (HicA-like mRNA interferase family)